MIGLIQNELMKQNARISTWIMLIFIIALTLLTAILMHNAATYLHFDSDWRESVRSDITYYEEFKEEEPFAEEQLLLANYRLEQDVPPTYAVSDNVWMFIMDNNGVIMLVSLFIIAIAATIVSSEFKQGTIKLLLVRPPSRIKVLLSKYVAVLIYAFTFLAVLWISSFIIGALFFGFDEQIVHLYVVDGEVRERAYWLQSIFVFLSNMPMTILLATLAFAISAMFSSDIMAIAISIAGQFLGLLANIILLDFYDWAIFLPFVNDLSQYVTDGMPLSDLISPLFSSIVLFCYWLLFIGIALFVFHKREIKPS
ncbi:ABC transporter permease [Bacillus sp. C1-1]|nr:ABC transporter permease [Bacillus sp. C1-1]